MNHTPFKILVAEDNEANQLLLKIILTKQHYEVDIVKDGQELIDKWEKNDYQLILTDIQMPVMDGLQATIKIREKEKTLNKYIPIIAITGTEIIEDEQRIRNAGIDECISKPYTKEKILKVVEKFKPL